MNCPPDIARILLAILEVGLLRIRALGWNREAEQCALEADHLHNIPSLLAHFSEDQLQAYWHSMRGGIVSSKSSHAGDFDRLWDQLARYVKE